MLAAWRQLEGRVEPASFARVAGLLEGNVNDVRIFVDCFGLYLGLQAGTAGRRGRSRRCAPVTPAFPRGRPRRAHRMTAGFGDHFGWQGTYLEFLEDLEKLLRGETLGRFLAAGATESQME